MYKHICVYIHIYIYIYIYIYRERERHTYIYIYIYIYIYVYIYIYICFPADPSHEAAAREQVEARAPAEQGLDPGGVCRYIIS